MAQRRYVTRWVHREPSRSSRHSGKRRFVDTENRIFQHKTVFDSFMHMFKSKTEIDNITLSIFNSAVAVHQEMGPGLLEAVYQHCLVEEMAARGLIVQKSVIVPLHYKTKPLNKDYIIDLLVEDEIILELKAVEALLKVHEAQLISYLKLSNKRLGFLINFNVPLLKQGFKRFVNNL
jgi:GxxExxY protein